MTKISNYARPGAAGLVFPSTPGGTGGSLGLGVTDGVTTISPARGIDFTSGATVTDLGGGMAGIDITGGGGPGSGDLDPYVTNTLGGQEVVNTVAASGASQTLDLADGNVHDVTLTGDCTLTLAGAVAGVSSSVSIITRQDGTGGWNISWPGSVAWLGGSAPTPDTSPSAVNVYVLWSLDGGVNWGGTLVGSSGTALTPASTVTDETTWGITPAVGTDTEYARQDHTHGTPADPGGGAAGGHILITDTPAGSPLIFADLLQNDTGTDLLYADA